MPDAPSTPLRDRLREQADASRAELAALPGLNALSYRALADRARALEDLLRQRLGPSVDLEPVAQHRRVLADVQRQLEGAAQGAVPPPNSAVYAAAVEVTELTAIAEALADASPAWRDALAGHLRRLAASEAGVADDRLALSLAALLRRAGFKPAMTRHEPTSIEIELAGWPVAFAFGHVDHAVAAAGSLRDRGRVGLLVLEAASAVAAMPKPDKRFGDDAALIAALEARLDALLVERQPALAAAVDTDHAFAVVLHATLAGLNVLSGRLLFVECVRLANLCGLDDPRIDKLRRLMAAVAGVR